MNRTGRCAVNLMLIIGLPLAHVAASATLYGGWLGTPAAAMKTTLHLEDQRRVSISGGVALHLSPDGQFLAVTRFTDDGDELCAIDTENLADEVCATFAGGPIGRESLAWAPDGTRIAFTEDWRTRIAEPDIWVFDITTGALANLTDDGYSGPMDEVPSGTPIDLAPAWSPDGDELVFVRSASAADTGSTALYRILATGGSPVEIAAVAPVLDGVWTSARWLADGTILYSVAASDGDSTLGGLWSVPADGGEPRLITAASDLGLEHPYVLVDVAPNGRALLLLAAVETVFVLVSPATGDAQVVELEDEGTSIATAALAPDGSRLLMSVSETANGDTQQRLVVRDLDAGGDSDLGALDWLLGALYLRGGLTWGTGGTVFGTGGALTGLLLEIGTAKDVEFSAPRD